MGNLIYLYGLIPTKEAEERSLPNLKGFDATRDIHKIHLGKVTAIVCTVDEDEYSEDTLKERINNDMEWLQEKAFHHHETVLTLSRMFTIVPLKFCTLYKSPDRLSEVVHSNEDKLISAFALIKGNEEWNLKIYCDDKLLKKQVSQSNPTIEAKRLEISQLSKGKQFFEKKKLDKLIDSEIEKEKNKISERIHSHLKGLALKGDVKKTWSNEATGKKEDMTWNSVYLISETKVEPFLEEVQRYERDMQEKGWKFEVSGPWPAYHFTSFS
ncbi:GvpL/GvpF family gas vesicle protein [Niallia sp. XMNu-256]|uniref:GvpL/GvpF family gas vesicle protein n=1 Tax=Niallia sp. XMNu-256 TaxID=3082444 RepID=UPI0030D05FE7